ncbi:MAG: hypothetical protein ACOVNK_03845, partial [Sphingorhabdus lacus]
MIAAIFGHASGPFALDILRAHPGGGLGDGGTAVAGIGVERTGQGHRLDNGGIITTRDKCHQAAHPAGMVDQCAQIRPGTLSARAFQNKAVQPHLDQMVVQRAVVL